MSHAAHFPGATMPHAHETKLLDLTLNSVSNAGVFEGYASLFDKLDLGRDVISPGAFRASLGTRGTHGVRMLFQHDPAEPLGTWDRIYEDARGLFVRGRLTLDASKAREIYALMKAGAIDGLSIGFRAVTGARDKRTGVRRLTEIDLWEISIVTFPMMPGARVDAVKGIDCSRITNRSADGVIVARAQAVIVAQLEEATRLIRSPRCFPKPRATHVPPSSPAAKPTRTNAHAT